MYYWMNNEYKTSKRAPISPILPGTGTGGAHLHVFTCTHTPSLTHSRPCYLFSCLLYWSTEAKSFRMLWAVVIRKDCTSQSILSPQRVNAAYLGLSLRSQPSRTFCCVEEAAITTFAPNSPALVFVGKWNAPKSRSEIGDCGSSSHQLCCLN